MRLSRIHVAALTVAAALAWRVATTAEPLVSQTPAASAEPMPILGLAGVTFRTSDMAKARGYYEGVLGFAEAFSLRSATGAVTSVFFKVNDDQYVEVTPNLKSGELRRLARVMVLTSNLERLHQIYSSRGVGTVTDSDGAGRQSGLPRGRPERRTHRFHPVRSRVAADAGAG